MKLVQVFFASFMSVFFIAMILSIVIEAVEGLHYPANVPFLVSIVVSIPSAICATIAYRMK